MRIQRRHEQFVAEHAEAAIDEAAARREVRGQLAAIAPDLAAGARIDRPREILRPGHVEHVVAQQRSGFEVAQRCRLKRPQLPEPRHVVGRDLRQGTVAVVVVVAAERQPTRSVRGQALRHFLDRHQRRRRLLRRTRRRPAARQTAKTWRMRIIVVSPSDRSREVSAGSATDHRDRCRSADRGRRSAWPTSCRSPPSSCPSRIPGCARACP